MKKLLLTTLLGAGMSMAMLAGPAALAATPQSSEDDVPTAVAASSMTLQQFLREHNLKLSDNELIKRAPLRTEADYNPLTILVSLETYDRLDSTVTPTPHGWKSSLTADEENGLLWLKGFKKAAPAWVEGSISLPLLIDYDNMTVTIPGDVALYSSQVQETNDEGIVTSTILTEIHAMPEARLLDSEAEADVHGTLCNDGSITIGQGFVLVKREVCTTWGVPGVHETVDTTIVISDSYRNTYLLAANGTHCYVTVSTLNPGGVDTSRNSRFDVHTSSAFWIKPGTDGTMGIGGRKPVKPGDGSGNGNGSTMGWERPGDSTNSLPGLNPNPSTSLSLTGSKQPIDANFSLGDLELIDLVGGSADPLGRKPFKPKGPGSILSDPTPGGGFSISWLGSGDDGLILKSGIHPSGESVLPHLVDVYMMQVADTVYVYNLFNTMSMAYMTIQADGTMDFPYQMIGENKYNFSSSNGDFSITNRQEGCTGTATPEKISWGITALMQKKGHSFIVPTSYSKDNELSFTNGSLFDIPQLLNITSVTRKVGRMLNDEEQGTITDVTTLIGKALHAE